MRVSNQTESTSKRRIWLRRAAKILLFGWLGFALVYLVVVNTILRTRSLDRWVTGAAKGLYLHVESGWTLWPGRVHVRGVELHFEDHNLQFAVGLDSGVVDLALWQLPGKVFHLTRVRAEGVRYLFRHKVESAGGHERRLERYPRIAGYSDPPLFTEPRTPPLGDEQYNLWTVQLDDVDALAKELWFLEYRFVGKARARGGFHLKPERDAQTAPCSLTLDGQLRVGQDTAASSLRGRIDAQLDRHDPRKVDGAQIFNKISFKADLTAQIPKLDFSAIYGSASGAPLRRGAGTMRMKAELRHGAWQDKSFVHYQTDAITVVRGELAASGPVVTRAEIIKGGHDAVLQVSAATPRVALALAEKPRATQAEAPSVHELLASFGVTADLTQPLRVTSFEAHARAVVPELSWFNPLLHGDTRLTAGSAYANTNLRWSERELGHGKLWLKLSRAGMKLGERTLLASGDGEAAATYDPTTQRGQVQRLEVALPEFTLSNDKAWKTIPGGIHAHGRALVFHGVPPSRVRGDVELEARTIEPVLPLVIASNVLRGIATAIVHLGETRAVVGIDRTPAALTLELKAARSGTLEALGVLRNERDAEHVCGRFFIQDPKFNLGVVLYRGETTVEPFVSAKFWRERPPTESCGPRHIDQKDARIFGAADGAATAARAAAGSTTSP